MIYQKLKIPFNIINSSGQLSVNAKCLTNIPTSTFQSLYKGLRFPGQCYSLNQQCQYLYGANSIYCNGVSLYFKK
jgi:hypothetical protein